MSEKMSMLLAQRQKSIMSEEGISRSTSRTTVNISIISVFLKYIHYPSEITCIFNNLSNYLYCLLVITIILAYFIILSTLLIVYINLDRIFKIVILLSTLNRYI